MAGCLSQQSILHNWITLILLFFPPPFSLIVRLHDSIPSWTTLNMQGKSREYWMSRSCNFFLCGSYSLRCCTRLALKSGKMWTLVPLNRSSFSLASFIILSLSWKWENLTRIGLGTALELCLANVGDRWARSMPCGAGVCLAKKLHNQALHKSKDILALCLLRNMNEGRLEDRLRFSASSACCSSSQTWSPSVDEPSILTHWNAFDFSIKMWD